MTADNSSVNNVNSPETTKHSSKKKAILAVVLILVLIAACLSVYYLSFSKNSNNSSSSSPTTSPTATPTASPTGVSTTAYNNFTAVYEYLVTNNTVTNQTTTNTITLTSCAGKWDAVGANFGLNICYYNAENGTEQITAVSSGTDGFNFSGSSTSLPATIPNSNSAAQDNLTIEFRFNSPAQQYTGNFNFTVYISDTPNSSTFTGFYETIVSYYTLNGQTNTSTVSLGPLFEELPADCNFTINIPYNCSSGEINITGAVCNTTGFTLVSALTNSSETFPIIITAGNNVTIDYTFTTPQQMYTGEFNFTVYITIPYA